MFGLTTLRRFLLNRAGGFALQAGIMSPFLLMATAGGIDFYAYANHKAHLQDLVDDAALAAVREAVIQGWTPAVAQEIAEAVIEANYRGAAGLGNTVYEASATPDEANRSVTVDLSQDHFPYFTARFFPSPQVSVTATATSSSDDNICVIALDPTEFRAVSLKSDARLTAPTCAVYSNSTDSQSIEVVQSSVIEAPLICAAGGFKGPFQNYLGNRSSRCPTILDPLAGRLAPNANGCDYNNYEVILRTATLYPGVYCGGLLVTRGSDVTFEPGVYVMKDGALRVSDTSKVKGSNVGFYFTGDGAGMQLAGDSDIDLEGREEGSMAGILFFQDRNANPETFAILTSNARNLVGVIYLPNSRLTVNSPGTIADESAYTAFIVHSLRLGAQGPNVVLNTAFASTDVPIPEGLVGGFGDIRLAE